MKIQMTHTKFLKKEKHSWKTHNYQFQNLLQSNRNKQNVVLP